VWRRGSRGPVRELVYDENGQLLTASLVDYLIPSASSPGNGRRAYRERIRGGRWLRGMGRGGTIGAPAAIANAIADALSPFDIEVNLSADHSGAHLPPHGTGQTQSQGKIR